MSCVLTQDVTTTNYPILNSPCMEGLARGMTRVELGLSYAAQYPILGTVAGSAKVAIGALQTGTSIGGATVGLLALPFGNKIILLYSVDHLKNGLGNILAGTLEAIPFVGSFAWTSRRVPFQRNILKHFVINHLTKTHPGRRFNQLSQKEIKKATESVGETALNSAALVFKNINMLMRFSECAEFQHYHTYVVL